jgi:hypothetical protein
VRSMASFRAIDGAACVSLAVALASQPGCGVAERVARGVAAGATAPLAGKLADREGLKQLAEGVKRRAAGSLVDELGQPRRLEDLQRIAAAMAAGTLAGASGAGPGATPIAAIAEQASRAVSRQVIAALGPAGDGPLAESLSATSAQVTESMARGARDELAPLFPECRGAAASSCLERAVERVSRASSAGVAAGIRDALGVWPFVLAFGGGALGALVVVWAWGIHRARR